MSDFLDSKVCPLCFGENRCGVDTLESCWCFDISIPKGLLELLPESMRNQACVCEQCVRDFIRDSESFKIQLKRKASGF